MKKYIQFPFFLAAMLFSLFAVTSCSKQGCTSVNSCNYDADAKKDDGTCINKGLVTFWQNTTGSTYDIVVTINATDATITTPLIDTPICDASGCANFSLCPGSHNYTAHEVFPGLATWTGNAVSTEDGCTVIVLE
jgi:hypothetical protein